MRRAIPLAVTVACAAACAACTAPSCLPTAPVAMARPGVPLLAPAAPMPLAGVLPAPASVDAVQPAPDLSGDGLPDLVVVVLLPEEGIIQRRIARSRAGGGWDLDRASVDAFRKGRAFWADIDGDGRVDVAYAGWKPSHLTVATGLHPSWSWQDPKGGWTSFGLLGALHESDDLLAVADLDGDGRTDLLSSGAEGTAILHNEGHPSAEAPVAWRRDEIPGSIPSARGAVVPGSRGGAPVVVLCSADGATCQAWSRTAAGWARDARLAAVERSGANQVVACTMADGMPVLATLRDGHGLCLWAPSADGRWALRAAQDFRGASLLDASPLSADGAPRFVLREGDRLAVVDPADGATARIDGVPPTAVVCPVGRGPAALVIAPAAPGAAPAWMAPAVPPVTGAATPGSRSAR
jgi:hypothetical protein